MNNNRYLNLQDVYKHVQQDLFIGRKKQISFFYNNLKHDHKEKRKLIIISGQGGIGKTCLIHQFRKIAEETSTITAYIDGNENTNNNIPTMMGNIAKQFEAQGYPLKSFATQYQVYRQQREELETEPSISQGLSVFVECASGKLHLVNQIPIGSNIITHLSLIF